MRLAGAAVIAFAVFLGTAAAQIRSDQGEELARVQRLKARKQDEIDRLIDRRFRHDLGLPLEDDPTMRVHSPVSTLRKDQMMQELRQATDTTAAYVSRYNKMKSDVEALRAEMLARNTKAPEKDDFVVVPQAGSRQQRQPVQQPTGPVANQQPRPVVPIARDPQPLPADEDVAVRLDRVRGQIYGSKDHLRVAQSLFKAGQALTDIAARARRQGEGDRASEFDARAKQRLERAVAELEPLLTQESPPYAALFCQGRCLELLFRHSVRYDGLSLESSARLFQQREQEVREPFLDISARDVTKTGEHDEVEVLGEWGRAAQSAVEHFRWVNIHGDFRPSTPIESLTWPGEKKR